MGSDEDVLDVLRLRGSILRSDERKQRQLGPDQTDTGSDVVGEGWVRMRTLIFVAPLTDFSKELDILEVREEDEGDSGSSL